MNTFRNVTIVCVCIFVMGMSGCGSDDNNADNFLNSQTGYFVDDFVISLDYNCGGLTGKTDDNGAFEFLDDQGCTFRLGSLELHASPEALYDRYISPYEVTLDRSQAITLAAIIQSASIQYGKRMILIDEITDTIQNTSLSNGNESVTQAFGSNPFSITLKSIEEARLTMAKNLNSNGMLLGDLDQQLQELKTYNGIASFGLDILEEGAKDYLSSQVLKAFGLDKNDTSQDLKEITDKLDNIESQLATIEKQVEALIGDFAQLDTYIEKTQYSYYNQMLSDMTADSDVIWNSYKGVFGQDYDAYLDQRTYNESTCKAFKTNVAGDQLYAPPQGPEPLFEAIAVILENFKSSLTDNTSYLSVLFEATQQYLLADKLPQVGGQSTSLKSVLDQYNEGLMNQYAYVLLTLQKFFILEQTLIYMGSSDTKKDLCNLALDSLWVQHDTDSITPKNTYAVNLKNLQSAYDAVIKTVKNAFNSAIVSDKIDGNDTPKSDSDITKPWIATIDINTKIINALGKQNYIPEGDWNKDACILYQWNGFSDWDTTFQGDFDGSILTAQCTYGGNTASSTLDMNTRCYDGSNDTPVMTQTTSPYLECQYLSTANLMSINKVNTVQTGFWPGNRNAHLDPQLVIRDHIAFSDDNTIYFKPTSYASGSYVSQFLQVNFDNGEKALVQFDAKSWDCSGGDCHYCSVQCGSSKGVQGQAYWSCGGNHSTDNPDYMTGDSEQNITSASGEQSVQIRVDGADQSSGDTYFHYNLQ